MLYMLYMLYIYIYESYDYKIIKKKKKHQKLDTGSCPPLPGSLIQRIFPAAKAQPGDCSVGAVGIVWRADIVFQDL